MVTMPGRVVWVPKDTEHLSCYHSNHHGNAHGDLYVHIWSWVVLPENFKKFLNAIAKNKIIKHIVLLRLTALMYASLEIEKKKPLKYINAHKNLFVFFMQVIHL